MSKSPKILFAVLDWGIGHATRSEPLIEYLISKDCDVCIAGSGMSLQYLQKVFPTCEYLLLPDYKIHYSKGNFQIPHLILQTPKAYKTFKKENSIVEKHVLDNNIDFVISDNRFGAYSNLCMSYYISHQLQFKLNGIFSVLQNTLTKANVSIIDNFDAVLIPDNDNSLLSGEVSKNKQIRDKCIYIGPLSRFESLPKELSIHNDNFVLFLLSGPEPQRSVLENKLLLQVSKINKKIILVRGVNSESKLDAIDNVEIIDFADSVILKQLIEDAESIVCRSGYSTIMDLWTLRRKALVIPTPGQPEQEYLAEYISENFEFLTIKQKEIDSFDWNSLRPNSLWEHVQTNCSYKQRLDQIIFK